MTLGSHDEGAVCFCCSEHRPPVLEHEVHHILPLYLGGTDTPGNRIFLCPTTHMNVHEILRLFLKHGAQSYSQVQAREERPVARYAFTLAAEGYRRWAFVDP